MNDTRTHLDDPTRTQHPRGRTMRRLQWMGKKHPVLLLALLFVTGTAIGLSVTTLDPIKTSSYSQQVQSSDLEISSVKLVIQGTDKALLLVTVSNPDGSAHEGTVSAIAFDAAGDILAQSDSKTTGTIAAGATKAVTLTLDEAGFLSDYASHIVTIDQTS